MQFTKSIVKFITFFSFPIFLFGQNLENIEPDFQKKIKKEEKLAINNPHLAYHNLKTLRTESLKKNYEQAAIQYTYGIISILFCQLEDYNQVIAESEIGEQIAKKKFDYHALIEMYQCRGLAYYELSFIDVGFREFQKALRYTGRISNKDRKNKLLAQLYGNIAHYYDLKKDDKNNSKYIHKSIDAIKKVSDTSNLKQKKNQITAQQFHNLGKLYQRNNLMDSAQFYYSASYKLYNDNHYVSRLYDIISLLKTFSNFYYQQKKYRSAIDFAQQGLHIKGLSTSMLTKRKELYEILYKSYLEVNQIDSSKFYSHLYSKMNDSISLVNYHRRNSSYQKLITADQTQYKQHIQEIIFNITLVFFTIAILIWHWLRNQKSNLHLKYRLLIEEFDQKEIPNGDIKNIDQKKHLCKSTMHIIDETLIPLLEKLEKFEKSNKFLKKELTLTTLAHDLNTNTRYISKIIKEHRGKNFNGYINALRIQYILQKLYTDPKYLNYKIAYLAYKSGFSSREVFATIFKKETGITPSSLIDQLKKMKRNEPTA